MNLNAYKYIFSKSGFWGFGVLGRCGVSGRRGLSGCRFSGRWFLARQIQGAFVAATGKQQGDDQEQQLGIQDGLDAGCCNKSDKKFSTAPCGGRFTTAGNAAIHDAVRRVARHNQQQACRPCARTPRSGSSGAGAPLHAPQRNQSMPAGPG